jgi:H+-transporting ATPase
MAENFNTPSVIPKSGMPDLPRSDSPANVSPDSSFQGPTREGAKSLLERQQPSSVPDAALHPVRRAITKVWAPVPWMLAAAIGIELLLHKLAEAALIAALLVFNGRLD